MTIIQVGPYPLSADCIRGGVESSVYGLAQALGTNHTVDVFDYPRISGKDTGGKDGCVFVHRYNNPGKHNQDSIMRVDEMLRDIIALHPDVVHIHGTGEISKVIYQAIKHYGIKVMLTVHGLLHVEKANQLRKRFTLKHLYQYVRQSRVEFETLSSADKIIVDTEYVAKQIEQLYNNGKITQIPEMHVIPQGINAAYLSLNSQPQDQLILSVGAISERKGHLYLLKAFEQVCATVPTARLVIVGSLADKQYYRQLQQYIAQSPHKERITIHTNLPQEQVFTLYQQAQLFALHSQEESQGIVFAEAMAVGLPVVATKVGGVPYVVEDGKSGLLCQYGDTATMAKMIIQLLNDKQMYETFSSQAQAVTQSYDWRNISKQVELLYTQLKY